MVVIHESNEPDAQRCFFLPAGKYRIVKTLFIVWKKEFSVKVAAIDAQHQQIFDIINNLYDDIASGEPNTHLAKLLKKVKIFTETHFRYEEILLKYSEYPDLNAHRIKHHKMELGTSSLIDSIQQRKSVDAQDLLVFLKRWWVNHIRGEDVKYIPHVEALEL